MLRNSLTKSKFNRRLMFQSLESRMLLAGDISEAIAFQSSLESEDAQCWTQHFQSGYNGRGCGEFDEIYDGDRIRLVETPDALSGNHAIEITHEADEDRGAAVVHLDHPTSYVRTQQYIRSSENYDFGFGQKIHRIWGSDLDGLDTVNFIVVAWGKANDGLPETNMTGVNDTRYVSIVHGGNPNNPASFGNTESGPFQFQRDRWHKVVTEVQLNNVGQADGWTRLIIDDVVVAEADGIQVRDSEDGLINRVMFGGWYSNSAAGENPATSAASPTTYLIDDVSIWTTPDETSPVLAAPEITAPTGTVNLRRPQILWTTVDGAERYEVRVVDAITNVVVLESTVTTASYAVETDFANGNYRAEVRTRDDNRISQWSAVAFSVNVVDDDPPPTDYLILFDFRVLDTQGNAISTTTVGQVFALQVRATDLRSNASGIFSVYADVEYDPSLVELAGEAVYGDTLQIRNGNFSSPGLINELGGIVVLDQQIPNELVIASIPFRGIAAGNLSFTSNSADVFPGHESTLFGLNLAVSVEAIQFGSQEFEITPRAVVWHNSANSLDVNDDGTVSPIDALLIINFISIWQNQPLSAVPVDEDILRFVDTNDDGFATPLDALLVINEFARHARVSPASGELLDNSEDRFEMLDTALPLLF